MNNNNNNNNNNNTTTNDSDDSDVDPEDRDYMPDRGQLSVHPSTHQYTLLSSLFTPDIF